MNATQHSTGDDYRRAGQKVRVTLADGSKVIGSCRWEDADGVKVDVPGQDTATYHASQFVTFVSDEDDFSTVAAEAMLREDYPSIFGPHA